jgi:hypothetical protein
MPAVSVAIESSEAVMRTANFDDVPLSTPLDAPAAFPYRPNVEGVLAAKK